MVNKAGEGDLVSSQDDALGAFRPLCIALAEDAFDGVIGLLLQSALGDFRRGRQAAGADGGETFDAHGGSYRFLLFVDVGQMLRDLAWGFNGYCGTNAFRFGLGPGGGRDGLKTHLTTG